jgi:hypothetical protein
LQEFIEASDIPLHGGDSFIPWVVLEQVAIVLDAPILLKVKEFLPQELLGQTQFTEGFQELLGYFLEQEGKMLDIWIMSLNKFKQL